MIAWLRRRLWRAALGDPDFLFLLDEPPPDEAVSLDCETTGLDPWVDEIVAIAAVPIIGNRIATSARFQAVVKPERMPEAGSIKVHGLRRRDVAQGRPMAQVLPELLRFIGPRPLVGYYIDFDVRMIDRYALHQIGAKLPNRRIEVSSLYYDRKYGKAPPGTAVDLRFAAIRRELGIPDLGQHDAFADALMAAMMWVELRDLARRGQRLKREGRREATAAPLGA
jgi:DNA polymerase-3 subunit epsilon